MAQILTELLQRLELPTSIDEGLMYEFRDSQPQNNAHPVITGILNVYEQQFKAIREVVAQFSEILDSRSETVVGASLNNIGNLIGQSRLAQYAVGNGLVAGDLNYPLDLSMSPYPEQSYVKFEAVGDTQYRQLIEAKKMINNQRLFTVNDTYSQISSIFSGQVSSIKIYIMQFREIQIGLQTTLTSDQIGILNQKDINGQYLIRYPSGYNVTAARIEELAAVIAGKVGSGLDDGLFYK